MKTHFGEGDLVTIYGIGNGAHNIEPQYIIRLPEHSTQPLILQHYKTKNLSYIIGSYAIVEAKIPKEPEPKKSFWQTLWSK